MDKIVEQKKFGPVSVGSCGSYDEPELSIAIEKVLQPLGGISAFVHSGDRVLLKPNLLTAKPPEREPFFGDSPGGRSKLGSFLKVVERSGLAAVAEELGVEVVRIEEDPVTISNPGGMVFKRFEVARAAVESDMVITLPRLKTHNLTGLTAGVKILYGCVPGFRKIGYHVSAGREGVERFAELLVDLAAAITPGLTLLDAVIAMEGDGPTSGDLRKVGVLMASADPFALDWVASELIGVPPEDFPTVSAAKRAGIGPGSSGDVELAGEPIESMLVRDFSLPKTWEISRRYGGILSTAARLFSPRPKISKNSCVNCGTCVESCPTQALLPGEPTPKYVQKKCIRCYCCAEFCPHGAIKIVRAIVR